MPNRYLCAAWLTLAVAGPSMAQESPPPTVGTVLDLNTLLVSVLGIITATIVGDEQTRCRDAGMDDFLGKPFQQHELRDALARFTENRGARA